MREFKGDIYFEGKKSIKITKENFYEGFEAIIIEVYIKKELSNNYD
ncbi:hypothetical protein [Clostridium aciditolerans]|nr:hypothetical protein [Clostridium aciditolerans]